MTTRNALFLIFCIVLVAIIVSFTINNRSPFATKYIGGEIMAGKQYARTLGEGDAFPSDIKEVEEVWAEAIPDHLLQIGGLDLFSWASIYHLDTDPPHIFRGEFRDRMGLYKGSFEYYQQDNKPLPEHPLRDFYMDHIVSGEVHFSAIDPKDDFYSFVLKPVGSEYIHAVSPEADQYRKQRSDLR